MAATPTDLLTAHGADPCDLVQARFTAFVRRWPAKALARAFGISVKTADSWREGRAMPSARTHMPRLVAAWGADFLDFVYAPVLPEVGLDEELARIIDRLDTVQRTLADATAVAATAGSPAEAPAPVAGERAEPSRAAARRARAVVGAARVLVVACVLGAGALPAAHDAWAGADFTTAADDWARVPGPRGRRRGGD